MVLSTESTGGTRARCGVPLTRLTLRRAWEGPVVARGEAGKLEQIRNYCETDAPNTYLVYLRYMRKRPVCPTLPNFSK